MTVAKSAPLLCAALSAILFAAPAAVAQVSPANKTPHVAASGYRATAIIKGTPLRGSNGMNFDDEGRLLVGHIMSSRVSRINVDTGAIETLVDFGRGLHGADDLTTDGKGVFWTSNMAGVGGESIYRVDIKSGKVSAIYSGLRATNGIQYNRRTGRLFADQAFVGGGIYELDPNGEKPARLITKEFPNANALDFDRDNNLVVTVNGTFQVINPDTGKAHPLGENLPRGGAIKAGPTGDFFFTGNGVYKLSADGKKVTTMLPPGDWKFDNLAVSPTGRIFTASMMDATIYEVANDGSGKIKKMFSPKGLPNVSSLAAQGNDLYVVDTHQLRRVDLKTGALTGMVGLMSGKGSGDTGFLVGYVHAGPDGLLYAINTVGYSATGQYSLPVYTVDPKTIEIKIVTRSPYQGLELPTSLYTSPTNKFIYATEFLKGDIQAVPVNDDQLLRKAVATNLSGPSGIVEKDGKLYVAEALGQRISVIDLKNGRQDILLTAGVGRPSAIDLDKDGNLLVLDCEGRRLLKIDPISAKLTVIADNLPIYPNIFSNWPLIQVPNGLAVTEDGSIYVGGNDDGSIWKFTSSKDR